MSVMSQRLDTLLVRADAPDGQVTGTLRPDFTADLEFRGTAYRNYTERGLEHQLSRLIDALWTGYQRGYDLAAAEVTGKPGGDVEEPWDARARRFNAEQARIRAKGMSGGRMVYLEGTGMAHWRVAVRDGALSQLDEAGFAAEFRHAWRHLIAEHRVQVRALKDEHYGPGLAGPRTRFNEKEHTL